MHPDRQARCVVLQLFSLSLSHVAGCGGAGHTVHADPPMPREQAVCEVRKSNSDGMGPWQEYRRFAADGRVLEGTGRRAYATAGVERFHYDADHRLVRIESEEGSRRYPNSRFGKTTKTISFFYDIKGLLFREQSVFRDAGAYPQHSETSYRYDAAGRIIETSHEEKGKTVRTAIYYDKDRPVRRETFEQSPDDKAPSLSGRNSGSYDPQGRLTSVLYEDCENGNCTATLRHDYSYDDKGRLTQKLSQDLRSKEPSDSAKIWVYDDAGRLEQMGTRTGLASGSINDRPLRFIYDQKGQMSASSEDGEIRDRYEYQGSCDRAHMVPEVSSPATELDTQVCIRTPLSILDSCFEPRTKAIPRSRRSAAAAPTPPVMPKNVGQGTTETDVLQKWVDFKEQEFGFAARFPESPADAQQEVLTFAWARRQSPFLMLAVEVYPVNPNFAPSERLERYFDNVTSTSKPADRFGDTEGVPKWLQTRKSTVVSGHEALDLEGEYEAGSLTADRVKKKARLIIVNKFVYFVYAMFPPDEPQTLRAADYFLSSFQLFTGKQPPTWTY